MEAANQHAVKASIVAALPPWIRREGLHVPDNQSKQYRFTFDCHCGKRPQITVKVPKGGATHQEMLAKLLKALHNQHGICGQHDKHYPRSEVEQQASKLQGLEKDKRRLLTKKRQLEQQHELDTAMVRTAQSAVSAQTERKRQEQRAESRRVDIDPQNKEQLTAVDLCTAKLSKGTGILDTVKYWAQGSAAAVLQLVMTLIKSFGLESQVAAELGAELDETNQYIVDRANAALQILKQCQTEEQRQHYRVVLTALAPKKVEERHGGMGRRVTYALGVNRNRAPFKDSVDKRAETDAGVAHMGDSILVGDTVVCRHGIGKLVECSGPADPCSIEIQIDDVVHTSEFVRMDNGEGGGRVRRVPISFSHPKRKTRKDEMPSHLKEKVHRASVTAFTADFQPDFDCIYR